MRWILLTIIAVLCLGWINHGKPATFYSVWNKGNPTPDGVLHVMMSYDGHTFFPRSTYVQYVPHDSTMCGDPQVLFNGGKLWIMCSQGIDLSWTGTTVEIASSVDGNTFTYVASVDFSDVVSGLKPEAWGSSWFVDTDGSVHLIASGTTDATAGINGFFIFEKRALDASLTSWSASTLITGTGFPSAIPDPVIEKVGSVYNMFYSNWNGGAIQSLDVAQSSSLTSGYTVVETGNWSGWGANYEAPALINLGGNNWRIYLDAFGGRMDYSETSAGLTSGWSGPATTVAPFILRHGNVIANPVGG